MHSFFAGRKMWGHLFNHSLWVTSETEIFLVLTLWWDCQEDYWSLFLTIITDKCYHTKLVSRCVLSRFAFITFFQLIQHDPFQTKQTNKPPTPKHLRVTGIATRTWEQLPSQACFLISFPILHGQVTKDESWVTYQGSKWQPQWDTPDLSWAATGPSKPKWPFRK